MRSDRFAGTVPIVLAFLAAPAAAQSTPTVSAVRVRTLDVFGDHADRGPTWLCPFHWADAVHIKTRESVIRRELLFQEGGPLREEDLRESERNLRRFGFLRHVAVTRGEDGAVDVTTKDAWTTEPRGDFQRVGGRNRVKFGFVERNLLGAGKEAAVFYDDDGELVNRRILYKDPQLFGTRLTLSAEVRRNAEGEFHDVELARPFRTTTTPLAWSARKTRDERREDHFAGGVLLGERRRVESKAEAGLGIALGSTRRRTRQLSVRYEHLENRFAPHGATPAAGMPADRRRDAVVGLFAWERIDYIKRRRIRKFDRDEDFNLGAGAAAGAGFAPRAFGSTQDEVLPRFEVSGGLRHGDAAFTLARSELRWAWADGAPRDVLWETGLETYVPLSSLHTLAGRLRYDHSALSGGAEVFLLGEDRGLRGYKSGQFAGERRLFFSLEDRLFFAHDVFELVSLGGAVFFDAGYAWFAGAGPRWADLHTSAGAGLRVAFSRSTRNAPIRIDVARALHGNRSRERWVVSILAGQTF